jgi:hypothetical protein
MPARILLGIMLTLLLGVRAAFPQAAAESVMLNGHAAAATTKAGSALGGALNKASNNLAGKIQTVPKSTAANGTVQHVPAAKTQAAGATTAPDSASGTSASGKGKTTSGKSMITSIQGARKN